MSRKKKRPEDYEIIDNKKSPHEISPDIDEERKKRDRDLLINQSTLEELKKKEKQQEIEDELRDQRDRKKKSNKSRRQQGGKL